jgi:signal transduction histidine kinase
VTLAGEPVGMVAAECSGVVVRRWRGALGAIASQLSMALERDGLLATERATAESLVAQNERLRELDAMKDSFVSSVSHELRTPLTSMVGFLEILRDGEVGELSAEQAHVVEIIERNGHRLERLIGDILVAARFDSGRMRFDMGWVDLAALLAARVESIEALAASRSIRLGLSVEAGLAPVWGDEMRLGGLVDNLLSNAVKFTPEGGAVAVSAGREDGGEVVEVTDTGMGMAPADLDHVFDRFYRAANAGTVVGTGLGLSIAQATAQAHGGRIDVTSTLGTGTTFRVHLPEKTATPDHDEVTDDRSPAARG